ncbi:MAG: hypothetical protein RL693_1993 [Verrucomicrobiota bacterium]|jgi:competence ComEA-like helix-hairpin-helix protein
MSELYNEDIFKKREAPQPQSPKSRNLLFFTAIALALLAMGTLTVWRMTHNPDTMVLNVNTASTAQLENLPGVGSQIAKDIVKGRPYKTPEDLKKVKGIGEKTFEKMKPRIRVE